MSIRHFIPVRDLVQELTFTASTSSGPGGQNVNKVNSKVTLRFDVLNSALLSTEEKEVLLKKLHTKLTADGILLLSSQEKRSQLQNKETVMLKLEKLLQGALARKKARKPTKPSKSAVQERIKKKKQVSEKKKWRQRPL